MEILNLDEAAIFGPGSEWLWTLLTAVVLGVSGLAIFRQLTAQRWGNELALRRAMQDEWNSERVMRRAVAAFLHIAQGKPGLSASMMDIGNWFETLADLTHHGLLQEEYVWQQYGLPVEQGWAVWQPRVAEYRARTPLLWTDWEKLAAELAERDRRAGLATLDLSSEAFMRDLPGLISRYIERLEIERDIKTGAIPTWPFPEPTTEHQ